MTTERRRAILTLIVEIFAFVCFVRGVWTHDAYWLCFCIILMLDANRLSMPVKPRFEVSITGTGPQR